jgi:hypothetical protein
VGFTKAILLPSGDHAGPTFRKNFCLPAPAFGKQHPVSSKATVKTPIATIVMQIITFGLAKTLFKKNSFIFFKTTS